MKVRILGVLLVVLLLGGHASEDDSVKKEMAKLQGTWIVVAGERDGKPLDRIKGNTLIFDDQQFTIKTMTIVLMGNYSLDPSKTPKAIDWIHQKDALKDKIWQAIYELDGDDLKICYADAESGKDRPRDFATAEGSSLQTVVLKREKK